MIRLTRVNSSSPVNENAEIPLYNFFRKLIPIIRPTNKEKDMRMISVDTPVYTVVEYKEGEKFHEFFKRAIKEGNFHSVNNAANHISNGRVDFIYNGDYVVVEKSMLSAPVAEGSVVMIPENINHKILIMSKARALRYYREVR